MATITPLPKVFQIGWSQWHIPANDHEYDFNGFDERDFERLLLENPCPEIVAVVAAERAFRAEWPF